MLQRTPPQRAINKHLPPPRPIPTGSPSTAPTNVAVSSLENHLAQLVQQNKKSEEERLKLKEKLDELSVEAKANRENLLLLRERYKMEKTEWRIGCDALQAVHNVSHLRTSCTLEKERLARLAVNRELNRARIAVVQRDHKLCLFRVRERELEQQISILEDQIEDERITAEEDKNKLQAEHDDITSELREEVRLITEREAELQKILAERANSATSVEVELAKAKKELAALTKTHNTQTLHLSTITAELSATKAKIIEQEGSLQNLSADLDASKAKLSRALRDEERDEVETEALVKAKMDLEVRIRKLEGQVKESKGAVDEKERELKRERKKVAQLEQQLEEVNQQLSEAQQELDAIGQGGKEAEDKVAKYRKEVSNLKSELAAVRKEAASFRAQSPDVEPVHAAKAGPSKKPKAAKKTAQVPSPVVAEEDDDEVVEVQDKPKPKGKLMPRPKVRKPPPVPEPDDQGSEEDFTSAMDRVPPHESSDDEAEPEPEPEPKAKAKPKKRQREADDDDDVQETSPPPPKARPKPPSKTASTLGVDKKGKQRATSEQPGAGLKPPSSQGVTNKKPSSSGSRQGSVKPKTKPIPETIAEEDDEVTELPKKKRKLGRVLSAGQGWSWDGFGAGANAAGGLGDNEALGIPLDLSPVKGGGPVPARSNFKAPKGLFG